MSNNLFSVGESVNRRLNSVLSSLQKDSLEFSTGGLSNANSHLHEALQAKGFEAVTAVRSALKGIPASCEPVILELGKAEGSQYETYYRTLTEIKQVSETAMSNDQQGDAFG